ncbi:MAG: thiamine pyrophosphate-dependent enzyme [Chloroflexi bacterium]|nr:thiamine pyrophosphate-dependent enzyme [Chloroflexota bacterium]MCI0577711.1 thiamine pyrophosphate-dependent enzyme [Chloroflexota bacterium]MCI0649794.1 thiamine pyrophosphate-dependent enzyme [Chloroflexota bacterium]MCI0730503.1 thiamine pyrophosphate-dependent enzyme [Chloroflexota bacterium]
MPNELTPADWLELYVQMRRMRAMEERAEELYRAEKTVGRIYTGRGQEAISVGSAYALGPADALAPLYRDMGAHLVRGVTAREIFSQYLGRAESSNRGKDSGLHLIAPERGIAVSMISNLTASLPVAVGLALAFQLRQEPRVAITYFGDGSTSTGSFHEGVNFAATRRLPVVFVCENNQWALSTPNHKQFALERLADRALGYGIAGVQVDGNDVLDVYAKTKEAVEQARRGDGPAFIEAVTMRMQGHSVTDPAQYVPKEMLAEWQARDPIDRFGRFLREQGALDDEQEEDIGRQLAEEIDEAVAYAESQPFLPAGEAVRGVYKVETPTATPPPPPAGPTRELTYRAAVREALLEVMERDERVFILGEDVEYGGVYGITREFLERLGPERILDTPIAEIAIIGAATGAALAGLRPVAEIQFADFIAPAMDLLVNMTARYHYRTETPVPLVIRAPAGAILTPHGSTGPFHSQNPEAWFAQSPGLKIVVPATPYDAKGLLLAAIADPDPVLFLEQKGLYNDKGPVPAGEYLVPLGQARLAREGSDLSIITYGAMVPQALLAAGLLAAEDVSVEVLDLRTLVPLDEEAVLATARKTGKVLIAHEATRLAGFGAELAALVAEKAFDYLDGPIVRVTAPDAPVPATLPLAEFHLPNAEKIAAAGRELAAY